MNAHSERFDRLDTMIREDRVIRNGWTDGQDRACLLAAISPEVGSAQSAAACPADLIPLWLAHLTVSMDDRGSDEAWPAFVRRYALVVRRAAETLDEAGWRRAEYRVRAFCVQEASQHTDNQRVLAACRSVIDLCNRVVAGDEPPSEEWAADEAEAEMAAGAAMTAEAAGAAGAAMAAVAAWTLEAAESAVAAAKAEAGWFVAAWAWDRMSTGILDAIWAEVQLATEQ